MKRKRTLWIVFGAFAIIIGLYPLIYLSTQIRTHGFLQSKPAELLQGYVYLSVFYTHIIFGGLALLTGWSQFSEQFRLRHLSLHRSVGKVYVTSVFLSSIGGFTMALFATGGIVSVIGFAALALGWMFSIIKAYTSILNRNIRGHQAWMVRNYALTFAAVTLRLYVPFSLGVLHLDYTTAFRIISWLCWVPNLLFAELLVRKLGLTGLSRIQITTPEKSIG